MPRTLARDATHVYAATADGLLLGSLASEAVASAAGIPRSILLEEPTIERVHRAALAHLALRPERIGRMARDVRRRGWLPIASFRVARELDRNVGRDSDEVFLSGAVRHLNDSDSDRSEDLELSLTFSWDLGDLAYHPEEIDISREAREVIELRDDILDEITQLYFDRRRALAQLTAIGDSAGAEVESLRLRVAELTAGIDAWTGGWFGSRAWSPVP